MTGQLSDLRGVIGRHSVGAAAEYRRLIGMNDEPRKQARTYSREEPKRQEPELHGDYAVRDELLASHRELGHLSDGVCRLDHPHAAFVEYQQVERPIQHAAQRIRKLVVVKHIAGLRRVTR